MEHQESQRVAIWRVSWPNVSRCPLRHPGLVTGRRIGSSKRPKSRLYLSRRPVRVKKRFGSLTGRKPPVSARWAGRTHQRGGHPPRLPFEAGRVGRAPPAIARAFTRKFRTVAFRTDSHGCPLRSRYEGSRVKTPARQLAGRRVQSAVRFGMNRTLMVSGHRRETKADSRLLPDQTNRSSDSVGIPQTSSQIPQRRLALGQTSTFCRRTTGSTSSILA